MNSQIITTHQGLVEFKVTGVGEAVLFVHGGHSNCFEALCHKGLDIEKFRLITPSRPGYGETPLQDNTTPKKAADLFITLLDYLKIEQVIVYGISAGGMTALELAANYPDRVKKLILTSAVTKKWLDPKGKVYRIANKIFYPRVERFTWAMVQLFFKITPGLMAKSFYPEFSAFGKISISDAEVQELRAALKNYNSGSGFINDIHQNIRQEILNKITCPTLIVHSKYDNSVPVVHAEHAHNKIKNSRLVLLENKWGHLIWIGKDAENGIRIIRSFLEE